MAESPVPLTTLSEDQRAQAYSRFTIIRPALEDGVTQAQVARTHNIPASTTQRWIKRYREKGLAGLVDAKVRSDKGKSRRLLPRSSRSLRDWPYKPLHVPSPLFIVRWLGLPKNKDGNHPVMIASAGSSKASILPS